MTDKEEIMQELGEIKGMLVEIMTLPDRVRSLENYRSYIFGGMGLAGFILLLLWGGK